MHAGRVLVTGAARGIGKAIAALLAQRGWRVAICDIDARALATAGRALHLPFFRCDVANEAAVRRCVKAAAAALGGLDALVNNAGMTGAKAPPLEKLRLAAWNRRLSVNLTGVFLMAKHCAPLLRRSRGAMVNIASTRALQSEPDTEAYSATEAGFVTGQNFIIDGGMTRKMIYED